MNVSHWSDFKVRLANFKTIKHHKRVLCVVFFLRSIVFSRSNVIKHSIQFNSKKDRHGTIELCYSSR